MKKPHPSKIIVEVPLDTETLFGTPDEIEIEQRILQVASQSLLMPVKYLIDQGVSVSEALKWAAYAVLASAYGREFLAEEFGIKKRTENIYAAAFKNYLSSMPDEATPEMIRFITKASRASMKQKNNPSTQEAKNRQKEN